MNSLSIINSNGQFTVDSREVAEMTEVRHSDLLEKISGYVQTLDTSENGEFRSLDFFIPSSYIVEGQQRNYPCYLLTRKGCDMVANKMTGEKGVLFTAAYVIKFEEMEKQQKPLQIDSKFLFQIATQLEEKEKQNSLLQTENKLLAGQTLEWTSRKVLEAIVKAYGASIDIPDVNGFQEAWKDFKKELLYNHSININLRIAKAMETSGRKTKPKTLSMIHDDELSRCISTASFMQSTWR
jgi:Rha family phage regulatory protein